MKSTVTHTKLTPPELAAQLGVSVDKILTWIHSGELRAVNLATRLGGRPRFRIDPADVAEFENRRVARPIPKTPKPRRRPCHDLIEFF